MLIILLFLCLVQANLNIEIFNYKLKFPSCCDKMVDNKMVKQGGRLCLFVTISYGKFSSTKG